MVLSGNLSEPPLSHRPLLPPPTIRTATPADFVIRIAQFRGRQPKKGAAEPSLTSRTVSLSLKARPGPPELSFTPSPTKSIPHRPLSTHHPFTPPPCLPPCYAPPYLPPTP